MASETLESLLKMTDADLEAQLGQHLHESTESAVASYAPEAASAKGALEVAEISDLTGFFRTLGSNFLKRFGAQIYSLLCDPKDPEYPQIAGAMDKGADALAQVFVVAFAAAFGWIPGVVAIVAAIFAKRLIKSGHQATCDTLKPA